jgi:ABC-type cobalamin/Fe3+-siderophores transport system ATPase subunit
MLELRRISKLFAGIPAVEDVSFSALPGGVTGYLEPNGSGKSTTMKMIAGLFEATVGEILFNGRPIREDLIGYKRRLPRFKLYPVFPVSGACLEPSRRVVTTLGHHHRQTRTLGVPFLARSVDFRYSG